MHTPVQIFVHMSVHMSARMPAHMQDRKSVRMSVHISMHRLDGIERRRFMEADGRWLVAGEWDDDEEAGEEDEDLVIV